MKIESEHLRLNEIKWNKWAKSYDSQGLFQNRLRQAQSNVVSLLDIKENINFLDIGCGTGYAIGEIAKLIDWKGEFYGVDLSSIMIKKAKSNFGDKHNFHFIKANAESIPLNDNFFDIIICTNSFHHYLNPDKALKEIHRLLKEGGKIYILDPTSDKWIVKVYDKIVKLFEPEHVKIYSTSEFQQLYKNARLKYIASKKIKFTKQNFLNRYLIIHIAEKKIIQLAKNKNAYNQQLNLTASFGSDLMLFSALRFSSSIVV